eukprot:RCo054193
MAPAVPTRAQVLQLYRSLLKAGQRFPDYNFRAYTERIVKEDFRINRGVTDPQKLRELFSYGQSQLQLVLRQTAIQQMYATTRVVVDPLASMLSPEAPKA